MDIYCPSCETACSPAATGCPKCGHRLAGPIPETPDSRTLDQIAIKLEGIRYAADMTVTELQKLNRLSREPGIVSLIWCGFWLAFGWTLFAGALALVGLLIFGLLAAAGAFMAGG